MGISGKLTPEAIHDVFLKGIEIKNKITLFLIF